MSTRLRVRLNPAFSIIGALLSLLLVAANWEAWNFGTLVGAIFAGLFLYDAFSLKGIALFFAEEEEVADKTPAVPGTSLKAKLDKLEKLHANHLLTAEEYAERRANVLRAKS